MPGRSAAAGIFIERTAFMTRKTRRKIIARWQIYLLLLLPLIYIIIFAYIPMGGLVLAFKKYNVAQGIWGSPWVGFDNFEKFFGS